MNSIYKLFASILNERLNDLIEKKQLIHSHQSGFQRNRSTNSRIWTLLSIIRYQKAKGKNLNVLYLDLKKAYDSV